MNMEIPGGNKAKEKPEEPSEERKELIERVRKDWHKNLMRWAKHKLIQKGLATNLEDDAWERVQSVYLKLLTEKTPIDLTRSEPDIRGFLNLKLDENISRNQRDLTRQKRTPSAGLISLEEEFSARNKKKLITDETSIIENIEMSADLERALKILEERNKKMADVIRKKYLLGKTLQDIADDYSNTRENIGQIEAKGLEIIKDILSGKIKSAEDIIQGKRGRPKKTSL